MRNMTSVSCQSPSFLLRTIAKPNINNSSNNFSNDTNFVQISNSFKSDDHISSGLFQSPKKNRFSPVSLSNYNKNDVNNANGYNMQTPSSDALLLALHQSKPNTR